MSNGVSEHPIRTWKEFKTFCYESMWGMLGETPPAKEQAFFLFRGVNDSDYKLLSSLARDAGALGSSEAWRKKIAGMERDLLNRFMREVEPYSSQLGEQYGWFKPQTPRTNTFWYLSVMQHYRAPTRLIDFTADFWTAVFFAFDHNGKDKKRAIYRLECKNENENDRDGNKLPKNQNGEPRWFEAKKPDTNQLLGHLIGYGDFRQIRLEDESSGLWKKPKQVVGWDQPHFQNARLRHQRAYFVYNIDVTKTLEEEIAGPAGLAQSITKFVLDPAIEKQIREEIERRKLTSLLTYLDLDREFRRWWKNPEQRPQE